MTTTERAGRPLIAATSRSLDRRFMGVKTLREKISHPDA
jgi:hypothetical protein